MNGSFSAYSIVGVAILASLPAGAQGQRTTRRSTTKEVTLLPDTPKHALLLLVRSIQAGDADKALECCHFPEDANDARGERDLVRAAAECCGAFQKLHERVVRKWQADLNANPHRQLMLGPVMPWEGEVELATETIDEDKAEVHYAKTQMGVNLVKQADRWTVQPDAYLRRFSSDPADPINGFSEYAKIAAEISAAITDGKISNLADEQQQLRRLISDREAAARLRRKHAGQ